MQIQYKDNAGRGVHSFIALADVEMQVILCKDNKSFRIEEAINKDYKPSISLSSLSRLFHME